MTQRKNSHRKGRRDFFKKAIAVGAGIFCAAAGGSRAAAKVQPSPDSPSRTSGRYRLTAHIRKYYERAAL